ncbi:MAG: hypothetical protein PHV06_06485 [bacterium]|nr:hypothetical protein [bacterium]
MIRKIPIPSFIAVILYLFTLPFTTGLVPLTKFIEEKIDIHLLPNEYLVRGNYTYLNKLPFPVVQGLFIPFPENAFIEKPSEIDIKINESLEPLQMNIAGKNLIFIQIPPRDFVSVSICFKQKTSNKSGIYLLTTTRRWKRSLQSAEFRIFAGKDINIKANYVFKNNGSYYYMFQNNFYPEKDLFFSWGEKGE